MFKVAVNDPSLKGELVFAHPRYDVYATLVYSQKLKRVVGIKHNFDSVYEFWDEGYRNMQQALDNTLPDTKNIFPSISNDETKIIVRSTSGTNAGTYYLWDRNKPSIAVLAQDYKALDPKQMFPKRYTSYIARDDAVITIFLTQPFGSDSEPKPTIIFPHRRPSVKSGNGFDYWTQFFANRGYNVLQINFRGSTGAESEFSQSDLPAWGLQMQQDVEDGARWLIDEGIADPEKICLVGNYYGAYVALMEAANDSGLYRCVVSFAGVTDIPALLSAASNYTNHKIVKKMVGSNRKELKQISPVERATEINIPVLLAHGDKDRVVDVKQSRKMFKRLKKAGKNVKYIEQQKGIHYLSTQAHRVQFFTEMDQFLKQHLSP